MQRKDLDTFGLVEKFNREVVGVPERTAPFWLNPEEGKWLREVLIEEVEEFTDAALAGDYIAQVDALLDLMYFAKGGLTRLGLTAEQSARCFRVVHDANMNKNGGNKGRGSDLDATKPEGWEAPEDQIRRYLFGGDSTIKP